ncbi:hypothetical protein IAU59_007635 [Kwoniella sp. CBS 9459]
MVASATYANDVTAVPAFLLHVGDIKGTKTLDQKAKDEQSLNKAARCLGVGKKTVERTIYSSEAGTDSLPSNEGDIRIYRDTMIGMIYLARFQDIVTKLNSNLQSSEVPRGVALIDIPGFEIMDHTTLEQLVINGLNEEIHVCSSDGLQMSQDVLKTLNDRSRVPNAHAQQLVDDPTTTYRDAITDMQIAIPRLAGRAIYPLDEMLSGNKASSVGGLLDLLGDCDNSALSSVKEVLKTS